MNADNTMNANNADNANQCPFLRTVMPYYTRGMHYYNIVKPYGIMLYDVLKPYILMAMNAFWIYVTTMSQLLSEIKNEIVNLPIRESAYKYFTAVFVVIFCALFFGTLQNSCSFE